MNRNETLIKWYDMKSDLYIIERNLELYQKINKKSIDNIIKQLRDIRKGL
jgi:hypothetical protein